MKNEDKKNAGEEAKRVRLEEKAIKDSERLSKKYWIKTRNRV